MHVKYAKTVYLACCKSELTLKRKIELLKTLRQIDTSPFPPDLVAERSTNLLFSDKRNCLFMKSEYNITYLLKFKSSKSNSCLVV